MEIELLSKMLREVLPERETVSLPGLGEFVSVRMPAAFSDRGRTITPPYVKISFLPTSSNDRVLVDMYASGNNIDSEAAETIVLGYLRELRETLEASGTVVFPSLGTLRRTRRGDFLFIQDDDLDIFPDLFGLQPISLRAAAASESASEASEAVSSLMVMDAKIASETLPTPSMADSEEEPSGAASDSAEAASSLMVMDAKIASDALPENSTATPETEYTADDSESSEAAGVGAGSTPEATYAPMTRSEGVASSATDAIPADSPSASEEARSGAAAGPTYESMTRRPAAGSGRADSEGASSGVKESVAPVAPDVQPRRSVWPAVLITIGVVAMGLAIFAVLGRLAPELVDRILYSAEDYKLLHS